MRSGGGGVAFWEGHSDNIWVQEFRFFDLLKVACELFRSSLGMILAP